MAKKVKRGKEKTQRIESDSKLFAFLAVLLNILGFIIAILAKKDDKYVMFYAKQGLMLFIGAIVAKAVSILLVFSIVGILFVPVVWIIYIVVYLIAIINSISGKEIDTPLIGKFARSINI